MTASWFRVTNYVNYFIIIKFSVHYRDEEYNCTLKVNKKKKKNTLCTKLKRTESDSLNHNRGGRRGFRAAFDVVVVTVVVSCLHFFNFCRSTKYSSSQFHLNCF